MIPKTIAMKKLIYLLILIPFFAIAQDTTTVHPHPMKGKGGMNLIKVNLSSLVLSNYSFTYERGITDKMSFSLGFRFMPKGQIPFETQVKNMINDNSVNVDQFQIGNTAITPEFRFYLGRGRLHGFYVAPYGRYASFDASVPVNYSYNPGTGTVNKTALFSGTVTSFSGGVMFGMQYPLSSWLTLDFWLVGAHYGSCNGNLLATVSPPMSTQEQQGFQSALDGIKADPFTFKGTVTSSTSATISATGPWVGIRGLGINLAARF